MIEEVSELQKKIEPEWEAMRMEGHGQVGDPVDTWEPWTSLRNTEALLAWEDT